MLTDDDPYSNIDQIDPDNAKMLEYWARRWGVSTENVLCAVRAVGPDLRNIVPEIWKLL